MTYYSLKLFMHLPIVSHKIISCMALFFLFPPLWRTICNRQLGCPNYFFPVYRRTNFKLTDPWSGFPLPMSPWNELESDGMGLFRAQRPQREMEITVVGDVVHDNHSDMT